MTRSFAEALGIPHLDDLLKEQGIEAQQAVPEGATPRDQMPAPAPAAPLPATSLVDGSAEAKDHSNKAELVYTEALDHAQKVFDLGYNIDPARAPRMFEVATGLLKLALDAADSKREAQLKAKKLMIEQQKLDLERQRMGEVTPGTTIETTATMVEDRNELIKRHLAEARAKSGKKD